MILWLKYKKKTFSQDDAVNDSIMKRKSNPAYRSLWTWIQPGDYELYEMGHNRKYIITVDDKDRFDVEGVDFIIPKAKEELKIWLDLHKVKIGQRIGFSECLYDFCDMKNNEYKDKLWVGYDLIADVEVLR